MEIKWDVKDQNTNNRKRKLTIPYNLFITGGSESSNINCGSKLFGALTELSTNVTLLNDTNDKLPTDEDGFDLTGIKYITSSQCNTLNNNYSLNQYDITLANPKNINIKASGPIKYIIYNENNNKHTVKYYDVTGFEHYSYDGDSTSYSVNINPLDTFTGLYNVKSNGINYGGMDSNELTLYRDGSNKITLKCMDGDFISGYKINLDKNKWYIKPYCIHVGPRTHCYTTTKQCQTIDDSKYVTLNTTEVGQSKEFQCQNTNSNMRSTFEFSCDSSGWSNIKSYCVPAVCPKKTLKINGKELILNETSASTSLTFSCSDYLNPEQVQGQVPEESEEVQEGKTFEITCNDNGEWDSVIKSNCPNKCLYISGSGIYSLVNGTSDTIACLNGSEYTDTCNFTDYDKQLNINASCSTSNYCILDPKWETDEQIGPAVYVNTTITTPCQDGEGTIEHTCLHKNNWPIWKHVYNCKRNPEELEKPDEPDEPDESKFEWKFIYTILIIVVVIVIIIIIIVCVSISSHSKKNNSDRSNKRNSNRS